MNDVNFDYYVNCIYLLTIDFKLLKSLVLPDFYAGFVPQKLKVITKQFSEFNSPRFWNFQLFESGYDGNIIC